MTPGDIHCLYKRPVWPKMDDSCYIWSGTAQSLVPSRDGVRKRLRVLADVKLFFTFLSFSQKQDVANVSVLYRYLHGKFSGELHSLIPPILTFTPRTRHVSHIGTNHPCSLLIPLLSSSI